MATYTEERDPNVVAEERREAREYKKKAGLLSRLAPHQLNYTTSTANRERVEKEYRAEASPDRGERLALYAAIRDEELARTAYRVAYYDAHDHFPA